MIESTYQRHLSLCGGNEIAAALLTLAERMESAAVKPEWLSVKQAAGVLGVGAKKVYQLCSAGQLRHQKIGKQIRIAPDDLDGIVQVKPTKGDSFVARIAAL